MALFDNGALIPGTIYGSGAGDEQNTGQAIFTAAAGDVLTVVNHSTTGGAPVTLQTNAGGTQTNVNASVTIEKLA